MASKPRLSLSPSPRTTALLLLLVAEVYAHGASHRVSSDFASAVPQCAQDCFKSFVGVNFPDIDCGDAASVLQCICQHTGASGFTAGEGAVQCLLAAREVGLCTGADVEQARVDSAYRMCRGQPYAAQPTHSRIQVTLRLDASSRLIVPTPTLRTSVIRSRTASVPTSNPATTTASPITATASLPRTLPQPTESEPASSPSGDLKESEDARSSPPGGLGTAEIAGLVAGLVAALAIAVIAICISRRRRKKHFPEMETGFFMSSEKLKTISRRFTILPTGENISAPLHGSPNAAPREFPMGPHAALESRRRTFIFPKPAPEPEAPGLPETRVMPPTAWVPPGAGLALTPATPAPRTAGRAASPPVAQSKPVLSITIPNISASAASRRKPVPVREGSLPKVQVAAPTPERAQGAIRSRDFKSRAPPAEDEDSPLTEFEEDDRDSPVQTWRPPSAVPQSASTALFFADKSGNWVLADQRRRKRVSVAELEGSSPVVAESRRGGAMAAEGASLRADLNQRPGGAELLRPPAEVYRQGEATRVVPPAAVLRSSAYTSHVGNPSRGHPLPIVNPLIPKPLTTRQSHRQPRASPRRRYSPALNPFLDENGISPVRSLFVAHHPAQGPIAPGQRSPTLGAPDAAPPASSAHHHTRRAPRRSFTPVDPFTTPAPQLSQTTLLAKRIGAERAAGLSLRDSEASSGGGGGGRARRKGVLPSTPTWKPLLTPERRGDDLYLSLR